MPFVEEQVLVRLEENISKIHSVTALLEQGHTPESLLQEVLKGMDIEITDTLPTAFACDCSKEKIEKAIVSIGERDICLLYTSQAENPAKQDFLYCRRIRMAESLSDSEAWRSWGKKCRRRKRHEKDQWK